ncbi:MAG: acetate kinase [Verrucomicrobiaceae bacterium]|jgi:acetate kinase|nr:MAG: acetate kinase [Verrucomicrobiaceae bacterium]
MKTSRSSDCVIVINCGSSSLKFAVLPEDGETVLAKGLAERLGSPEAVLKIERDGQSESLPMPSATHRDALQAAVGRMGGLNPRGIGHRMVHGGEEFSDSVLICDEVLAAVERCSALAPLHNPANLTGVRTARELFPELPQVAVFDTAFHQTLPAEAYLYAIPFAYYEDLKVRRYGFHGTSHHYVALEAARLLGKTPEETSLITMHLGNGCSACAIRDGRSVDSTMGLTPSEGLVMGTRSGDVDPALHQFLQDQTGMRLGEITAMLNSKSGLLGLSGLSNDMRTLSEAARNGHARAKLAIQVFCYRLAKAVCGLSAALDRIDALVFTGGIGENSAEVRALTAVHLKIHGVHLDDAKNASHGRSDGGRVSSSSSRIPCLVVPTNEELMIARETLRLIS